MSWASFLGEDMKKVADATLVERNTLTRFDVSYFVKHVQAWAKTSKREATYNFTLNNWEYEIHASAIIMERDINSVNGLPAIYFKHGSEVEYRWYSDGKLHRTCPAGGQWPEHIGKVLAFTREIWNSLSAELELVPMPSIVPSGFSVADLFEICLGPNTVIGAVPYPALIRLLDNSYMLEWFNNGANVPGGLPYQIHCHTVDRGMGKIFVKYLLPNRMVRMFLIDECGVEVTHHKLHRYQAATSVTHVGQMSNYPATGNSDEEPAKVIINQRGIELFHKFPTCLVCIKFLPAKSVPHVLVKVNESLDIIYGRN